MAHDAAASASCEEKGLVDLMNELGIIDEDLDDLVYDYEDEVSDESSYLRWLAIGKVHTSHEYGDFWFHKNMRNAWDLAQSVKISFVGR